MVGFSCLVLFGWFDWVSFILLVFFFCLFCLFVVVVVLFFFVCFEISCENVTNLHNFLRRACVCDFLFCLPCSLAGGSGGGFVPRVVLSIFGLFGFGLFWFGCFCVVFFLFFFSFGLAITDFDD